MAQTRTPLASNSTHRPTHEALVNLSALYDAHRSWPLPAPFPLARALLPCFPGFLFGFPGAFFPFFPFFELDFLPFLGLVPAALGARLLPTCARAPRGTSGWGGGPPRHPHRARWRQFASEKSPTPSRQGRARGATELGLESGLGSTSVSGVHVGTGRNVLLAFEIHVAVPRVHVPADCRMRSGHRWT